MGKLTTHVLDTAHGRPASGMKLHLLAERNGSWVPLKTFITNSDGRIDGPALEGEELAVGRYELLFEVGRYFAELEVALPSPTFLDEVPIRFGIYDADQHYHVPLLVSPWSYSTYRGS